MCLAQWCRGLRHLESSEGVRHRGAVQGTSSCFAQSRSAKSCALSWPDVCAAPGYALVSAVLCFGGRLRGAVDFPECEGRFSTRSRSRRLRIRPSRGQERHGVSSPSSGQCERGLRWPFGLRQEREGPHPAETHVRPLVAVRNA